MKKGERKKLRIYGSCGKVGAGVGSKKATRMQAKLKEGLVWSTDTTLEKKEERKRTLAGKGK